ncbi:uncharacterized protein TRIADDRAFT_53442 [Trichoplax adhaerens]|uniref:Dolichyldiphosphatase n=1 Tax=Trichoplax adhaerens TaxID=10228 RepID=B3RP87_TRIAD|nr:hypothetical protein TRIADDRAFT_53442 [Trichoplax adhaerens]EDV27592.1 hypothetical protein TRIADDRAFT_53442 [Trichoplax adhaerens]|eukprot:XP_002109426.1 hypothetical protein TRIADDRAFT_53442 [Trichoplax adhaerens]
MAASPCHDQAGPIMWKAVSLTYVEYPAGDLIGKLLAYSSLMPVFIGVSFVTLILFKRDLHTMSFFFGLVLNEITSLAIKYSVRQPRPCRSSEDLATEFGMPSSHAQFMGFFAVYFILLLNVRAYALSSSDRLWNIAISAEVAAIAIVVSYSRIYLMYHTTMQVLVGFLLGTLLGVLWFLVNRLFLAPKFFTIASW